MYLSGFTFVKNAITLGYPVVASIKSIEAICDEVIINVGFEDEACTQDDGTWEMLTSTFTDSKYKFLKSWWDPKIRKDGLILSQQTNIALEACQGKYCQYIQADEVLHEDDHAIIMKDLEYLDNNENIDGLIFKYIHFYGGLNTYLYTKRIYRREIRLIRNKKNIISWKDAQGFKYKDESKVAAVQSQAYIYHYGWARAEQIMKLKLNSFNKLYHEDTKEEEFNYGNMWGLKKFVKKHPKYIYEWNERENGTIDLNSKYKFKIKDLRLIVADFVEDLTGYRMGEYKNFKEIKR